MAKSVVLSDSVLTEVNIKGYGKIIVAGSVFDDQGLPVGNETMVTSMADLPVNVKNTLNNALKHLSREFNKFVADEDTETWADL